MNIFHRKWLSMMKICVVYLKWIWCTFWFNFFRRIENNLIGCFFLFLAPVGGSNPAVPSPDLFANPAGHSQPILNLTSPKIVIDFIIFNDLYTRSLKIVLYCCIRKVVLEPFIVTGVDKLKQPTRRVKFWYIYLKL